MIRIVVSLPHGVLKIRELSVNVGAVRVRKQKHGIHMGITTINIHSAGLKLVSIIFQLYLVLVQDPPSREIHQNAMMKKNERF